MPLVTLLVWYLLVARVLVPKVLLYARTTASVYAIVCAVVWIFKDAAFFAPVIDVVNLNYEAKCHCDSQPTRPIWISAGVYKCEAVTGQHVNC